MHKYKLSKFIRHFQISSNEEILYNSRNRSIVSCQSEYIEWPYITSQCPSEHINTLQDLDFFNENIDDIESVYNDESSLIISIETMLNCNLACPYCYQIGNKKSTVISDADILYLITYIKNVYNQTHYKNLTIKILGGEPALKWEKSQYILSKLKIFTAKNNIELNIMIDTNGTIVEQYLSLNQYPSVLFTIPLTNKKCHDIDRKYHSGIGTYDDIINNIIILKKNLPKATIVLRYNADAQNIHYFEQYIEDLSNKLSFSPIISPNYTMNLGDGKFKNALSHPDFIKWLSTECIDILAKYNFDIIVTPYTLSEKCQYWSKYSLKIFSDGTVGACAMNFFDTIRPHISVLANDIDAVSEYWNEAKKTSILYDVKCRNCDSIFLCGGTYKLPCIKTLGLEECLPNGQQHIDLESFIKRYIEYSEQGKSSLFVGFNNYNMYK